ncbi:MAG: hypothetical protein F4Z01_01270 [Gammaproteobacteria bacterium]|nr:hypothetical protein [Gammaproteobacteria bacterium]MYF37259.1 hypothetical protein [Gammaproteobacteria bacterium]
MKSALHILQYALLVIAALVVATYLNGQNVAQSKSDSRGENSSRSSQIVKTASRAATHPVRIEDLEIPDEPFARNVAIASWILEIDENRLSDWLSQSIEATWKVPQSTRDRFQTLLIQRLATSNPEQAIAFALARADPIRTELLNAVFSEWGMKELSTAIERVKILDIEVFERLDLLETLVDVNDELDDEDKRQIIDDFRDEENLSDYALDSVKRERVEKPKEEWYKTLKLAQTQSKTYDDLVPIAQVWIDESGVSVLDEINDSVTSYGLRKELLTQALTWFANSQPEQAFNYALTHDFPGKNFTLNEIVRAWASEGDAVEALQTLNGLPNSQLRRELVDRGTMVWMGIDWKLYYRRYEPEPLKLLDNLHLLPASLHSAVSATAIESLVSAESPTRAVEMVFQLDETLQLSAARALVEEWARRDLNACVEWVLSSPDSKDLRNKLYHTLAWKLLDEGEPELAFQVGLRQPIPYHGFGLEGDLMGDIASDDLSLALELLPDVREGTTQMNAYVSVAEELFNRGKTEEAIDLGTDLESKDHYHYYLRLSWTWAQSNPKEFLEAIEQIPGTAVRSYVARQQILWHHLNNYFTTNQLRTLDTHLNERDRKYLEENR